LDLRESFESFLPKLSVPLAINFASSPQIGGILRCTVTNSPVFFWHSHQVFDLYVTEKYRVLFVIDRDIVVSFSIGTHSIVSK
jgi:hypothetical protein